MPTASRRSTRTTGKTSPGHWASCTGEVADLFGAGAVPLDVIARRYPFRQLASKTLLDFSRDDLRQLDAYVAGVNAGLASLKVRPWEYLALRSAPRPGRGKIRSSCSTP